MAYNRLVRFQNKITDIQQVNRHMEELSKSTEPSYLWCHVDGRLVIYDALLTSWNKDKRILRFELAKSVNKLPLSSLTQLNLFHEDLLIIYKCPIESFSDETLTLKAPESILKLAEAENFLPELMAAPEDGSMDKGDLELISQVLEVINNSVPDNKNNESDDTPKGPSYVFAKKPEIKETSSALGFSNKGMIEEGSKNIISDQTINAKRKRIKISRSGVEPATYMLNEVETHGVSFQTGIKAEFKVGDDIVVHSILDSALSVPLTAKVTASNKPSEYAKHLNVEAKFDVALKQPKVIKVESEKVGVQRQLAKDHFSHESIYALIEINTKELHMIEKRKGEFNSEDKIIISSLYDNKLKKPINAYVKSFCESVDGRIVIIEFLKTSD